MRFTWCLAGITILTLHGAAGWTQDRPPIIDMHMHARVKVHLGPDGRALPRPCDPEPCTPIAAMYTTDESIFTGTLDGMRRYNIVLAFLSDVPENVWKWVAAAPDRFLPARGWGPDFPDIEKLRDDYRAGRFKGMGEIGTQYATIAPNDSRLDPYFALAEEQDVPVLIHAAGLGAHLPGFRSALGRPLLLEDVLVRHRTLRIYLENAGYPFLDDVVALMTQYPQVYADLSTITWIIPRTAFHRYLHALVEAGLGKRLMFGSDQMNWPETIGLAVEAVESAPFLTSEQKRDIFYNNAARFLRLDGTEARPDARLPGPSGKDNPSLPRGAGFHK